MTPTDDMIGSDGGTTSTVDRPQSVENHDQPARRTVAGGAFSARQLVQALPGAVQRLDPRSQLSNPVMFVVWVGSVLVTGLAIADPSVFGWLIAIWLWCTVLFANLAEAVAEGRGKAQAESLRRTRTDTIARRLADGTGGSDGKRGRRGRGAGVEHRPEDRRPRRGRGGRGHPR